MGTGTAITVGLLSALTFTPQLGNFYGKASIEQNIGTLTTNTLNTLTIQIFQTPPPPCDPVNDPSSCRSS